MHVAVIGTGNVGANLARGLVDAGHEVTFGARNPTETDVQALADEVGAVVGDVATAAREGEAVVLAVPASAAPDVAEGIADDVAGDVVIDPTNSLSPADPGGSIADRVAEAAPEAHVAKAFNTVGAEWFTDPGNGDGATMFVCGDDEAVATAGGLAADLGFHVVNAGDRSAAFHLENLARFWIYLSRSRGRDMAFRLVGEDA